MCLTIIEILFLIAGLWLLILGKVPARLFGVLFGSGNYQMSSTTARLFGLLLASPWPVALGVNFILALIIPKSQLLYGTVFEILYDFLVAIIAIIIARRSKQTIKNPPVSNNNPKEN